MSYFLQIIFNIRQIHYCSVIILIGILLLPGGITPVSASGEAGPGEWNLTETGEKVLIHHWNFNDIPNDVFFSTTSPELLNLSSRLYGALLSYDGGSWDRVNHPTQLNARETPYDEEEDRALRLRNPSGSFTITLPTSGYYDMVFRYAVTRTTNGAHAHEIMYSVDGGETFMQDGLDQTEVTVNDGEYKLVEVDFSGIEGVDNNRDFQVRLTMTGEGSEPENDSGNQRFNNITLDGSVIDDEIDRELIHHWKFDDIPNDVFFPTRTEISAGGITGGQSSVSGAWIRYDGDSWDRVNAPTPFNARTEPYDEEDDRALRLRNPSGDFLLRLPTRGHSDVVFRYVVKRTANGAQEHQIAYSTDGSVFITEGLPYSSVKVGEHFIMHELDFSGIEDVNDNPDFTIRITPSGVGSGPDNPDGNLRFNHITVDAKPTGTSAENTPGELPDAVRLEQNYPNPFNPATEIRFSIPEQSHVTLEVFDVTGRHVETLVDRQMSRGEHSVRFNADGLTSGLYLYRLQADGQTFTRRMTFVK